MARKSSVERANEIVGGFATAQKNIVVQYGNKERKTDDILHDIRQSLLAKGVADSDVEKVDVYIKPEDHKAFYVVNGDITGSVEL